MRRAMMVLAIAAAPAAVNGSLLAERPPGAVDGDRPAEAMPAADARPGIDLVVFGWVSDPTPAEGDTIEYVVRVVNRGTEPARQVAVTSPVPRRFTLVTAEAEQGVYDRESGVWTVGRLDAGRETRLVLTQVVHPQPGGAR